MIPPALQQLEASEAISLAGLAQGDLVERFLRWESHEFVADLFRLRAEADAAIHADPQACGAAGELAGYPIGFCKPIRDFGLSCLLAASASDELLSVSGAIDMLSRRPSASRMTALRLGRGWLVA